MAALHTRIARSADDDDVWNAVSDAGGFDAHRLLQLAKHHGCQEALTSRLMTSYRGGAASVPREPGTARRCSKSA